jgi:poly-gamma-glutamate capsule biosynthesis protein CapA/YwtB (metallophosphatase superfamily)
VPASITLALTGDVMLGRGIDQILRHPCEPDLFEDFISDARDYVALAERAHGRIPRCVSDDYVWGDALPFLHGPPPDARIVNLETSVTTSGDYFPKGINYRMNPRNAGCLTAARVDCCVLANNHVLDWGETGLLETLDTLKRAGIQYAGAGRDEKEAALPAILGTTAAARIVVYGFGLESSGIPPSWRARPSRPGVNLLGELSERTVAAIAERANTKRRNGDLLVASIHWGPNWGYTVPREHRAFAHRLIEAGFAVVHGHSSHHAVAMEIYRGGLILYGCGDFITDYEGIIGHEEYRGDLAVLYRPELAVQTGRLVSLSMHPFRMKKFRLDYASEDDAAWLHATLDRESGQFGMRLERSDHGVLYADLDKLAISFGHGQARR